MALYPMAAQEAPSTLSGSSILSPRVRTRTRRPRSRYRLSETPDLFAISELLADLDTTDGANHHGPVPSARQLTASALTFATRPARKTAKSRSKIASAPEIALDGSIHQATDRGLDRVAGDEQGHCTEVLDFTPKLPRFTLPKTTEYARGRMAALLTLIARSGGRVDFSSWEELAGQLDQAGLIEKAHPSNLRHWVGTLESSKIVRQCSPGWIVFPLPEESTDGSNRRKMPASRSAHGFRLTALRTPEDLIAAGFSELETLQEGGRA